MSTPPEDWAFCTSGCEGGKVRNGEVRGGEVRSGEVRVKERGDWEVEGVVFDAGFEDAEVTCRKEGTCTVYNNTRMYM